MSDIYREMGYESRQDYLENLAADYRVPEDVVFSLSDLLGESEDFDGLISAIEDAEKMDW